MIVLSKSLAVVTDYSFIVFLALYKTLSTLLNIPIILHQCHLFPINITDYTVNIKEQFKGRLVFFTVTFSQD